VIGHGIGRLRLHLRRQLDALGARCALAFVNGPKVERRVEGSQTGDVARNVSRGETTRND